MTSERPGALERAHDYAAHAARARVRAMRAARDAEWAVERAAVARRHAEQAADRVRGLSGR